MNLMIIAFVHIQRYYIKYLFAKHFEYVDLKIIYASSVYVDIKESMTKDIDTVPFVLHLNFVLLDCFSKI